MTTYYFIAVVKDGAGGVLDSAEGQVTVRPFSNDLAERMARQKLMRDLRTPGIAIPWLEAYGMDALEGRDPNRKVEIALSRLGHAPFNPVGEGT